MDIVKSMETLLRIVDLGSYSRAAADLQVTPAMVSKRILELEAKLGVKLLNRNSHAISLTSVGTEYYRDCVFVVSKLKEMHSIIIERQNTASGDLKIICAKTFGERVLSKVVSDFAIVNPDIRVNLVLRDMTVKTEDLMAEGFDLLVRTRDHPNALDASLVTRKIITLPRVLAASPDYLKRVGAPRQPSELQAHNCLNPNGLASEVWTLGRGGSSFQFRVSGYPLANSSAVIRTACERGLGIAMLSRYTIDDLLINGKLSIILPEFQISSRALFVFYNKTRYLPARSRLFMEFLATSMRRSEFGDQV